MQQAKKITTPYSLAPSIRILPMSESDPEFTGKRIEEVQEWFRYDLPGTDYNFKKGMSTESGTVVLFQYKGHIIASAILSEKKMFGEKLENTYSGAYRFTSIGFFKPITKDEMKTIWPEFPGFNQVQQKLNINGLENLEELLLGKDFSLVGEIQSEGDYQERMELIPVGKDPEIIDEPRERKQSAPSLSGQKWMRDAETAKRAIVHADYCCECDPSHAFFTSRTTNRNYVEAHHLIPMEFQDEFLYSLNVEANILALCPLCHRKIHHAVHEEKEQMIKDLYNRRKERLKEAGIEIALEKLLSFYI